jgi:hypothetical protein
MSLETCRLSKRFEWRNASWLIRREPDEQASAKEDVSMIVCDCRPAIASGCGGTVGLGMNGDCVMQGNPGRNPDNGRKIREALGRGGFAA